MKSGDRYSFSAMTLHWLMAVLILGGFFLGLYADQLALSPLKLRTINWHKWINVTVLLLLVVRLAWRSWQRPPTLPAGTRRGNCALHSLLMSCSTC